MPDCPERERIQAYTDGELPGSEAARLAEHISRCPRCEAVHRWLTLISSNLSAQARPQPAPELLEAIRGAVDLAEPVAQISCSDAQSLISAHLDEELTAKEQLLMWRHLFTCQTCYQQFVQTRQLTEALRQHTQPVLVPAGLEANVHKVVDAEIARREVGVISLLQWSISKRAVGVAVAAAAALLVGLLLIPQQPVTKAPQVARAPAEVTAPIEVAVTLTQPVDVEPKTAQPAEISKADRAPEEKTAVPGASGSRPGATLASAGTEALQPVSPVHPPTDTNEGPTLALYRPGVTPASPTAEEEPPRIKYTPVAQAGESIYANLEPVAESQLDAASEGVNERVAMNMSYSKRPELEIVH